MENVSQKQTFIDLGVSQELCQVCDSLGWTTPTRIQLNAIPYVLQGRDVVGLAETGSGKTGAFGIPIIQDWLKSGRPLGFVLVLSPTRELALQLAEQLTALGGPFEFNCLSLIGGVNLTDQVIQLGRRKHHAIIGTPGRTVEHLQHCRAFATQQLATIKHLVLDEADRMLDLEFEESLTQILRVLPKRKAGRQTQLFSATMSPKVEKLKRLALSESVLVQVCDRHATAENLIQFCLPATHTDRHLYLDAILDKELAAGGSAIVFCRTCLETERIARFVTQCRRHGNAAALNSQLSQEDRTGILDSFRDGRTRVLVATDLASRGLDISHIVLVVCYDVPSDVKWYQHRVGRTARAGRSGRAVTIVTREARRTYMEIEERLGQGRLPLYPDLPESDVLQSRRPAVDRAMREANRSLRKATLKKRKKSDDVEDEDDEDLDFLKYHHSTKQSR